MISAPARTQTESRRSLVAKPAAPYAGILLVLTILFNWKVLLTHQYSFLTGYEGVNQAYAWLNFWAGSIKQGHLPLWDPYTWSGHVFLGEMQTSAFDPLNLLYLPFPFNRNGVFSPELYHLMYAFVHFLAAYFMFRLVRELELSSFAGLVAGICFSFGGMLGRLQEWPHLLHSAIWLPLIFLFLLRAMRAPDRRSAIRHSSLCGLVLGLSILGGGLHFGIMQAIVIFSAAVFYHRQGRFEMKRRAWPRAAWIVGLVAVVAAASGAVQLLPSMEYGHRALRFLGSSAVPAADRIPYGDMSDGLFAHGLFSLILPLAFGGQIGSGETLGFYLGVFPLLLAIIGIWKNWANPWVRYLVWLAAAAFLYSLGGFSLLHGLLYALVPLLSAAREASRFMYLADFSLAVLAAFGVEALFSRIGRDSEWGPLGQVLKWIAGAGVAALVVPALFNQPQANPWISFSILMIVLSYALFRYIIRGRSEAGARFLIVALILFDLSAFNWSMTNVNDLNAKSQNQMRRLLSLKGAAEFVKSRPGLFRASIPMDMAPNAGDLFHVQLTSGSGVTLLTDYTRLMERYDLLNVRYFIRPASATDPGPLYQDAAWKVYENPKAYPRAWLVHRSLLAPDHDSVFPDLDKTNLRETAVVESPVSGLAEPPAGEAESVRFARYEAQGMTLDANAASAGLVVLSEMYYPGWKATVNGRAANILQVDGGLRGVVVPAGCSRIELRYEPSSFRVGAAASLLAFLCVAGVWIYDRRAGFVRGFLNER